MDTTKIHIPRPSADLFENPVLSSTTVLNQNTTTFLLDHFEYPESGGILVYVQGTAHPKKGFPFPEAIKAVNEAKRVFIELIKIFTIVPIIIPFLCLKSVFKKVIESYLRISLPIVSPFFLRRDKLTPVGKELYYFVYHFLDSAGCDEDVAKNFGRVISAMIDYDDAYRYRVQDIFSETDRITLAKKPLREIYRLIKIYSKREENGQVSDNKRNRYNSVRSRGRKIAFLLMMLLMVPKFRWAFKFSIIQSEFHRFQYDEDDIFWTNLRGDYLFRGKTYEERMVGVTMPQAYQVQV